MSARYTVTLTTSFISNPVALRTRWMLSIAALVSGPMPPATNFPARVRPLLTGDIYRVSSDDGVAERESPGRSQIHRFTFLRCSPLRGSSYR